MYIFLIILSLLIFRVDLRSSIVAKGVVSFPSPLSNAALMCYHGACEIEIFSVSL